MVFKESLEKLICLYELKIKIYQYKIYLEKVYQFCQMIKYINFTYK